jgi:hypothetical protein
MHYGTPPPPVFAVSHAPNPRSPSSVQSSSEILIIYSMTRGRIAQRRSLQRVQTWWTLLSPSLNRWVELPYAPNISFIDPAWNPTDALTSPKTAFTALQRKSWRKFTTYRIIPRLVSTIHPIPWRCDSKSPESFYLRPNLSLERTRDVTSLNSAGSSYPPH